MFRDKVVVITGGAHGIGLCMAQEFEKQGAHVCVIDKAEGPHYVGDIADKQTLEAFAPTNLALTALLVWGSAMRFLYAL